MKDWMDFNSDGEVDGAEMMFAEEMLCTSRKEHEALFGDAGDFDDDTEDDFETDAMAAGLDASELEFMDSTGVGVMIGRYKKFKERGIPVFISNPSLHAERIFKMSGLYEIMPKIS